MPWLARSRAVVTPASSSRSAFLFISSLASRSLVCVSESSARLEFIFMRMGSNDACTWQSKNPGTRVTAPKSIAVVVGVRRGTIVVDQGPEAAIVSPTTSMPPSDIGSAELDMASSAARYALFCVLMVMDIFQCVEAASRLQYIIFPMTRVLIRGREKTIIESVLKMQALCKACHRLSSEFSKFALIFRQIHKYIL